jgi:hypothetical protein
MLYIVYAESANYCGYGQHFVVEANDEVEAQDFTEEAAEEYFCEQDRDQLEEDGWYDLDGMIFADIKSVEEFGPGHTSWEFYQDPSQAEFYIKVNFNE